MKEAFLLGTIISQKCMKFSTSNRNWRRPLGWIWWWRIIGKIQNSHFKANFGWTSCNSWCLKYINFFKFSHQKIIIIYFIHLFRLMNMFAVTSVSHNDTTINNDKFITHFSDIRYWYVLWFNWLVSPSFLSWFLNTIFWWNCNSLKLH